MRKLRQKALNFIEDFVKSVCRCLNIDLASVQVDLDANRICHGSTNLVGCITAGNLDTNVHKHQQPVPFEASYLND